VTTTLSANPAIGPTVAVRVVLAPGRTMTLVGLRDKLKLLPGVTRRDVDAS
jgi:hypothetical protein